MDELMIKPGEAAKLLHVGRTQMYRLIKSKEVPSCRVGKSIRVPVAQLKAWAERAVSNETEQVLTRSSGAKGNNR